LQLTVRDFKAKYLGSYLGLLWAFIQPLVTILILWFVFQVGFKSMPVSNCPFILWLIAGIIPWFFFADAVSNTTGSVLEYSYLVKKMVFRVSILPVIKILSAFLIHLFFVLVLLGFFIGFDYRFSLHVLQIPYYLGALIVLIMGISYFTASVVVFLRDISQLVSMFLQFGFWGTPIFWSLNMIPDKYQFFLKLNPVFYIINGYRDALIYRRWFWESWELTLYFWCITLLIFVTGATVFKRLRPHFADIL
jgi:lipopolysaccharide transport system permease protein/teichoic acid transport system permease protein